MSQASGLLLAGASSVDEHSDRVHQAPPTVLTRVPNMRPEVVGHPSRG